MESLHAEKLGQDHVIMRHTIGAYGRCTCICRARFGLCFALLMCKFVAPSRSRYRPWAEIQICVGRLSEAHSGGQGTLRAIKEIYISTLRIFSYELITVRLRWTVFVFVSGKSAVLFSALCLYKSLWNVMLISPWQCQSYRILQNVQNDAHNYRDPPVFAPSKISRHAHTGDALVRRMLLSKTTWQKQNRNGFRDYSQDLVLVLFVLCVKCDSTYIPQSTGKVCVSKWVRAIWRPIWAYVSGKTEELQGVSESRPYMWAR